AFCRNEGLSFEIIPVRIIARTGLVARYSLFSPRIMIPMFSRRTDWKLTPNHFTKAQREIAVAGREVLDLTISNPTRAGLRYDEEFILKSLVNHRALDYDPQSKGLHSAREAVATYYRDQHTSDIDSESLIVTTSTSEGYS